MPNPIDEKEVLEILKDHQSNDLKKARRNLMVVSFAIVLVHVLDLKISDLKVFGLDFKSADAKILMGVGVLVILYWLFMMHMYIRRDDRIFSERRQILDAKIKIHRQRLEKLEAMGSNSVTRAHYQSEMGELRFLLDAYDRQINRTAVLRMLVTTCGFFEYVTPVLVACAALNYLIVPLLTNLGLYGA